MDLPRYGLISEPFEARVVCPECFRESSLTVLPGRSWYDITCPFCRASFSYGIFKVRAKSSKGQRLRETRYDLLTGRQRTYITDEWRDFSVRVIDFSGREDLIEFSKAGIENFDIREGDIIAFYYYRHKLVAVQNLTIRRWLSLEPPAKDIGCLPLLAWSIALLIFLGAILAAKTGWMVVLFLWLILLSIASGSIRRSILRWVWQFFAFLQRLRRM